MSLDVDRIAAGRHSRLLECLTDWLAACKAMPLPPKPKLLSPEEAETQAVEPESLRTKPFALDSLRKHLGEDYSVSTVVNDWIICVNKEEHVLNSLAVIRVWYHQFGYDPALSVMPDLTHFFMELPAVPSTALEYTQTAVTATVSGLMLAGNGGIFDEDIDDMARQMVAVLDSQYPEMDYVNRYVAAKAITEKVWKAVQEPLSMRIQHINLMEYVDEFHLGKLTIPDADALTEFDFSGYPTIQEMAERIEIMEMELKQAKEALKTEKGNLVAKLTDRYGNCSVPLLVYGDDDKTPKLGLTVNYHKAQKAKKSRRY